MPLVEFKDAYVVDDLLPEDIAVEVFNELHSDKFWRQEWKSVSKKNASRLPPTQTIDNQWHWHREIWQDQSSLPEFDPEKQEQHPNMKKLWVAANEVLIETMGVSFLPVRAYANAHTYGVNGLPHKDDGDVTVIYYPCQDWDPVWEGGTALYTDDGIDCRRYCTYKFNRLFMFPAKTLHRAMPLTRDCTKLRTVIVFKCVMDTDHPTYEKFYNER